MTALDVAYGTSEQRTFLLYNTVALLLTVVLILFVGVAMALVAILPALIGYVPLPSQWLGAVLLIRWPILLLMIVAAVVLLYRFGPNRSDARWELGSAGALLAVFGLITGSYSFSVYISAFAAYDKTYGSLGAVAVLLVDREELRFHAGMRLSSRLRRARISNSKSLSHLMRRRKL
jgi:membrane protein